MRLNNIGPDMKVKRIEEKISRKQVGEGAGTSGAYLSGLINHPEKIVDKTYPAAMGRPGYDVQLAYVKREKDK